MKRTTVINDDAPDAYDVSDLEVVTTGELADDADDPDNFPPLERPDTEVHCSMQFGDVRISVLRVTRELALFWVRRHNTRNRKLRPTRKNSYARDMLADDWMFNGDSLRFDEDGTIIDGQHRLEAVIESGVESDFLVVENLPIDVQVTIDIGAMRTMADQLAFKGFPNPTTLGAVARRLCRVKNWEVANPTRAEMRRFVQANTRLAERATDVALLAQATRLPAAPSVIGSAFFLAAENDEYAAELFFVTKLINSVGLEIGEPAHTLRSRYQKVMAEQHGTQMDPESAFRYAIHAWNQWRAGVAVLTRLQRPKNGWPPYSELVVK